jgi:hypothetical protein
MVCSRVSIYSSNAETKEKSYSNTAVPCRCTGYEEYIDFTPPLQGTHLEFPAVFESRDQCANMLGVRFDLLWEPEGDMAGLQDVAFGSESILRDLVRFDSGDTETLEGSDSCSYDFCSSNSYNCNSIKFRVPMKFTDYISKMFPWNSPLVEIGYLEAELVIPKSVLDSISHGLPTLQQIENLEQLLENDKIIKKSVQRCAEDAFYSMVSVDHSGHAMYSNMYQQTVPSAHGMTPCFHVGMQLRPSACRVDPMVAVSVLMVGCAHCAMSAERFSQLCFEDNEEDITAALTAYKMALMSFGNCFKYQCDKDARGRNSERFTNMWALVGAMASVGLDNSRVCGDCEDSAYAMAKLHVGIQNMDLGSTTCKPYHELLVSAQRLARYFQATMPTCGTYAINPNQIMSTVSHSTHTTMVLIPGASLNRMLSKSTQGETPHPTMYNSQANLHGSTNELYGRHEYDGGAGCGGGGGNPAWGEGRRGGRGHGGDDDVQHIGHRALLCEGTSLVSQKNDSYNTSRGTMASAAIPEMHTTPDLGQFTEETHVRDSEGADFYDVVVQLNLPCMGYYVKQSCSDYGTKFFDFLDAPEASTLQPMYPVFTEEQADAMWRNGVVECVDYSLAFSSPHEEQWTRLQQFLNESISRGGINGIVRGSDSAETQNTQTIKIADGVNIVVY